MNGAVLHCCNCPVFVANEPLNFTKSPSPLSDSTAEGENLVLFFDNFARITVDKTAAGTYNRYDITRGLPWAFLPGK